MAQASYLKLKSIEKSSKTEDLDRFYEVSGRFKYCIGEIDSSIYYFKKSALNAYAANNVQRAGRMINNAAAVFEISSQLDSSVIYYDSALFFAKIAQDSAVMGAVLIGKGIVLEMKGLLTQALINYQEAEKMNQNKIDVLLTARLNRYVILIDHFPDQMNYEELYGSYQLSKSNDLDQLQASLLQFVAAHKRILKEYDSANHYYDLGINIANHSGRPDLTGFMLEGKAKTALDQNLIGLAIQLLDSGRNLCENSDLNNPLIQVYTTLSKALILADQPIKSISVAKKAIALSELHGQKEVVTKAYEQLAKAYSMIENYDLAFKYQRDFTEKSNEILDHRKSEQLTFLQTKYETEKITNQRNLAEDRAELAELESQKNKQLLAGSIVIGILLIASLIFYTAKQRKAKEAEIVRRDLVATQKQLVLEKQYRDSELKALKAQMNPHFIFNVLNSIQEFIVLNKKELASDYLAMFAELIRSYLHFSNTGFISLKEEIESLHKYLELESLRFTDSFSYRLYTDEIINADDLKIPTMIIQPYVENAIKHGLFHKKSDRELKIQFSKMENTLLRCEITDNGIGRKMAKEIKSTQSSRHSSFAMEATANRLELLNQRTTNKIGIETIDLVDDLGEARGTQVILFIPIS